MFNWGVILFVSIILILGGILIMLMGSIIRNFNEGKKFREQLLRRLKQLPMFEMLAKRNIDVNNYLYNEQAMKIEKQLLNCEQCRATVACKEVLSKKDATEETYSICPNNEDFKQIKYPVKT